MSSSELSLIDMGLEGSERKFEDWVHSGSLWRTYERKERQEVYKEKQATMSQRNARERWHTPLAPFSSLNNKQPMVFLDSLHEIG